MGHQSRNSPVGKLNATSLLGSQFKKGVRLLKTLEKEAALCRPPYRRAMVDDMSKRQHADTSVRLPADFEATIKALLKTPPPPAGDPSTRKQQPKKKPAQKAKRR
jgi:hypothetical protein